MISLVHNKQNGTTSLSTFFVGNTITIIKKY